MTILAMVCIVTAAPLPITFLSAEDVQGAPGVRIEARVPEPGHVLLPKDPDRPKLWYAPVAALPVQDAVRIWYQRVNSGEAEYADQRTLCVGDLRDGKWSMPELHSEPPAWGGANNVCLRRSPHKPTWGGFNVFQIVHDGTLYRMLYWDQPAPPSEAGAMLATSRDGLTWEKDPRGAVFTEHNDAYSLIQKDSEFLLYQTALEDWPDKPYPDNLPKWKRVLCLRSSPDLVTWTPQEVFLRPDAQDPPETEFYLLKVFRYGQGFAGIIMKYYADPNLPNKHSAILKNELVVSKDARTWSRPFRAVDIGFWSYADPFVDSGAMQFVIWKDGGMHTVKYRPNGLTAAVAETEAVFRTPLFEMPETGVALNADARDGEVVARLMDGDGKAIGRRVRVKGVDSTAFALPLSERAVKRVAGKPCRLEITMRNATLYAVEPGDPHCEPPAGKTARGSKSIHDTGTCSCSSCAAARGR